MIYQIQNPRRFRGSFLLGLLVVGISQSFGQAPSSIGGFTYRDDAHFTSIRSEIYTSLEFHADGTYVTRASILVSYVSATAVYAMPVGGSFTYVAQSTNQAAITLTPASGSPEVLNLTFSDLSNGSVNRGETLGMGYTGNFSIAPTGNGSGTALVNISSLGVALQGGSSTIGFVVGGTQLQEFLVRSVGPALSTYGVTAPAANPVYSLRGGAAGNWNWPGEVQGGEIPTPGLGVGWSATAASSATLTAETTRAGAFPLALGSNDKADIFILSPGAYTIVVAPQSLSAAGANLIEVYQIQ